MKGSDRDQTMRSKTCARCRRTSEYTGDWYRGLCPECADNTDGEWICFHCRRHGMFEEMGGNGALNPTCCGSVCQHGTESDCEIGGDQSQQQPLAAHELKLMVPTYNAALFAEEVANDTKEEFGEPSVPMLIREAEGVRIVLGTHDFDDMDKPDIQIERQPNGWMIFLHPLGGSDACGYVYFLDDGRSFLCKENAHGPTPAIGILESDEHIPEIHGPPPTDMVKNDADPFIEVSAAHSENEP